MTYFLSSVNAGHNGDHDAGHSGGTDQRFGDNALNAAGAVLPGRLFADGLLRFQRGWFIFCFFFDFFGLRRFFGAASPAASMLPFSAQSAIMWNSTSMAR